MGHEVALKNELALQPIVEAKKAETKADDLKVVGTNVKIVSGFEKVTGKATYNNDVRLKGMLHAKVLRSIHANAEVLSIDTSEAEALPGVKLVMSNNNFPHVFGPYVYYVGCEVAMVVASDVEIAERALDLIKVEYKVNPAVIDPVKAMESDSPLAFPKIAEGYVVKSMDAGPVPAATSLPNVAEYDNHQWFSEKNEKGLYTKRESADYEGFGDVEKGFSEADIIVEEVGFRYNLTHAPFISPDCSVADWNGDKLTLYVDSQYKHGYKFIIASVLGLPLNKVNLVSPFVGGSFGGRLGSGVAPSTIIPSLSGNGNASYGTLAAVASMAVHKPVRLEFTKAEDFIYHWGRGTVNTKIKIGFKKDGTLTTMDSEFWRNATCGALLNGGGPMNFDMTATGNMIYSHNCEHNRNKKMYVHTNAPSAQGWQGWGNPEIFFAVESTMDIAAEKLGMDPIELRKKNHIRPGDNILDTCYGFNENGSYLSAGDISKCLDLGAEKIGWKNRRPHTEKTGRLRNGLGLSLAGQQTAGAGVSSSTMVKILGDGTAHLVCAYSDLGQGGNTAQMQMVAEVLGLPYEKISQTSHDTDSTPFCSYQACSSGTVKQGFATYEAAQDAKRKLLHYAAPLLEEDEENLDTKDGMVFVKGNPKKEVSWAAVFDSAGFFGVMKDLVGYHSHTTPNGSYTMEKAAAFASVDVDTETGELLNLKIVHAQDVGKAIYPKAVEGVFISIHHGLEAMVGAEMILDPHTGKQLNNSWIDYPVASIKDFSVDPIVVETPGDTSHPYGASGVGQANQSGIAAAVANAIYNAIGVRMREVPFTPDKILKALGKI